MCVAAATGFTTGLEGHGVGCPPCLTRRLRSKGEMADNGWSAAPLTVAVPLPRACRKAAFSSSSRVFREGLRDPSSHTCSPGGLSPVGLHSAPTGSTSLAEFLCQLLEASVLGKQMSHPSSLMAPVSIQILP